MDYRQTGFGPLWVARILHIDCTYPRALPGAVRAARYNTANWNNGTNIQTLFGCCT